MCRRYRLFPRFKARLTNTPYEDIVISEGKPNKPSPAWCHSYCSTQTLSFRSPVLIKVMCHLIKYFILSFNPMITITFVRLWYDLLEPNLVLNADMDEEVFRKKQRYFYLCKLQRLPSDLASLQHHIILYLPLDW